MSTIHKIDFLFEIFQKTRGSAQSGWLPHLILIGMNQQLMKKAQKRVEEKKGFFGHLGVYLAMSIFFLVMNLLTWDGEFWFFFPLLPWGVGLLIHYFSVFGLPFGRVLSPDWEDQQLAREVKKLQQKSTGRSGAREDDHLELKELEKRRAQDWQEDDLV